MIDTRSSFKLKRNPCVLRGIVEGSFMKTGIFPLQIVSFPGELINLHIFEERYRQLINECVDEEKSFVLPPIINGKIKSVANLMVVEHVVNVHEDGAIDIKCRGCEKVRITDIVNPVPGRLYAGADIVSIEESPIGDEFKYDQIQALVLRFQELIKAEKNNYPYGEIPDTRYRPQNWT